jgi:enterochelin esterase-like enzyme
MRATGGYDAGMLATRAVSTDVPIPDRHRVAAVIRWCLVLSALLGGPARAELQAFELDAPAARTVYLAGEMTRWDQGKLPMSQGADGRWRISVDLAPGQWLYKFVVDGRWMADPATADHDADGQGGQHSFVFVGKGDWQELPSVAKGRVDTLMLASKAWAKAMKLNIYLPPAFERGKPYPVLWLLHGGGMDADQWLKTGKVERYMDNLIARGAIAPFVVVMPSSGDAPYVGPSEEFITSELPTWLGKTYGLRVDRKRSAVAGMSMGGLGAFSLPLRHPDRYGFSFALSGYFSDEFIASLPASARLAMQSVLLCGSDDELVATNRKLVAALQARHARFTYREDPGGHTWQYWSQRMVEMLSAADAFFRAPQLVERQRVN